MTIHKAKPRPKHRLKTTFNHEIDLLNPKAGVIDIRDIAWSLGKQCRFNGHTNIYYSVAEHSLIVMEIVAKNGGGKHDQLCALLHDAHEAYLGDMIQPLKSMEMFEQYILTLEDKFDKAIQEKFALRPDSDTYKMIRKADMDACATEMRALTTYEEEVYLSVGQPQNINLEKTMFPGAARDAFLQAFRHLEGKDN